MKPGQRTLLIGGARSGKSQYAVELLRTRYEKPAIIATAQALDKEMEERIAKHKASRPSSWVVIEEPLNLVTALRQVPALCDVVLIDCITIWLSNVLLQKGEVLCEEYLQGFLDAIGDYDRDLVMVTNEVGMGVVPHNPLGRTFRDLAGRVNQRLAEASDRVVFIMAGLPLFLKGMPQ